MNNRTFPPKTGHFDDRRCTDRHFVGGHCLKNTFCQQTFRQHEKKNWPGRFEIVYELN